MTLFKHITNFLSDIGTSFINEMKRIFSDAGAVLIVFFGIALYAGIYSLAYEKEIVNDIQVALVDLDNSNTSHKYTRMADATDEINITYEPTSIQEAKELFFNKKVHGIIVVDKDFEKDLLSGEQSHISVYCDASYFLLYKQVLTASIYSSQTLSAGVEIKHKLAKGQAESQALKSRDPLPSKTVTLHNPTNGYGSFVMPGLIIVILQQTLLVVLAMLGGTTHEKKNFYINLPSNKTGAVTSYVLGRSAAYLLIYLVNGVISLVWIYDWFDYPNKISFIEILPLYIPFILASTFLGISIACLFEKRVHSFMYLVFLSPIVLFLSGLSWPAEAMPSTLYGLAHILPSTYMVPGYLRMRTMGASLHDIAYELNGIYILMTIYFVMTIATVKYQVYKYNKR
ncbi:MAG: ABC transporter permease [Bacteroidota bacterium]|nr:ABC transporter permease [Bacteroidota bacterium]